MDKHTESKTYTMDNLEIGKLLGRGGWSTVHMARTRDKKHVFALNIRRTKPEYEKFLLTELDFNSDMRGMDGVVKFYGYSMDKQNIYMAYEYGNCKNLSQAMRSDFEINKPKVIRDILIGLVNIHSKNWIHNDIKSENIMIFCKNKKFECAKIGDFDLVQRRGSKLTLVGTPVFFPSEKYRITDNSVYDFPIDMWAVGCVVYEMYSKNSSSPFETATSGEIIAGYYKELEDVDEDVSDFIKKCLDPNPSTRLTAIDALSHNLLITG